MALEAGNHISDLVQANPAGIDPRSQGDDHLRLIKKVLQTTFPNANHAFRFPATRLVTTGYTVLPADHNVFFKADMSGGNFTIVLPGGGGIWDGFEVRMMKIDSSANNLTVDGNGADLINGAIVQTVSGQYTAKTFIWDGSQWWMF